MALPPEHAALLARGDYPVHPAAGLDPDERRTLERYGYWLAALARGELAPSTPDQEQFVRVARGEAEPRSAFETAWVKNARAPLRREAVGRLARLNAARGAAFAAQAEYAARREAVMDKVRDELAALDAEYEGRLRQLADDLARAEADARDGVLTLAESVRLGDLRATYCRPRTTWDGKGLTQYAQTHPELERFRRVGKPTVRLQFEPPPGDAAAPPPAALGHAPDEPPAEEPY